MTRIAVLGVALVALVLVGCSISPVAIAPSNVPLGKDDYTALGPATGRALMVSIMGFPISEPNPVGRARDRAIASVAGAEALVNIATDFTSFPLGPVSLMWTSVHATAVTVNK
ncbi:MAG: hypothetical protein HY722_04290 [Planctomycetes bacterium]|nr:hypothetical protein [Planctomycetota bacterium]